MKKKSHIKKAYSYYPCFFLMCGIIAMASPVMTPQDAPIFQKDKTTLIKKEYQLQLLWGTFIGGSDWDHGMTLKIDDTDDIIVAGPTKSTNLPTPNGYIKNHCGGEWDIYVAKLSKNGNQLKWGTYIGGSGNDFPYSICLDKFGNIVIVGWTWSDDIPTFNGFDQSLSGHIDIYVAKLSSDGSSLLGGTYIGGSGTDLSLCVALDQLDNIYISGMSFSSDIPTPNGYDQSLNGVNDIYLAKLKSDCSGLEWGTYIGGESVEHATSIAIDNSGAIIIAGGTQSSDIPVPNGYDQSYNGNNDIYIAKLSSDGKNLIWGTFIGGESDDSDPIRRFCYSNVPIAIDKNDNVILASTTRSSDIPTPEGYDQSFNGDKDIYVAKLNSSGDQLLWGTYIGGSVFDNFWSNGGDEVFSIALDNDENIILCGDTTSIDIPTPNGFDTEYTSFGDPDFYLAKLSSDGKNLLWGTYLGQLEKGCGVDDWGPTSMALDRSGNIVFCGGTKGEDIPVPNGNDPVFNGMVDFYIGKISETSLTVTSPNGGESWERETTKDITWTPTGVSGDVTIELYKGGTKDSDIGTATASSGTYSWDIPSDQATGTDYKVKIYQGSIEDYSDDFSIVELISITITSPNGGESWQRGTTYDITWIPTGLTGDVTIDLYKSVSFHSNIGTGSASDGSYPWEIPDDGTIEEGDDYQIIVYQGTVVDYSGNFSIIGEPFVFETFNYHLANTSSVSNKFTLWMEIFQNGVTPDPSLFNVKIVDKEDHKIVYAEGNPEPVKEYENRWLTTLDINKERDGAENVLCFEEGIVEISRKNEASITSSYFIPSDKLEISVYGTDFDMEKHSYGFDNGDWDSYLSWGDSFFIATEVVSEYLNPIDQISLWKDIGYIGESVGLCYGMANSVIANYTHRDEIEAWGMGGIIDWLIAVQKRWPFYAGAPSPPHKPYDFNDVYNDTYDVNILWSLEACKKIVYYHVTQKYYEGIIFNGWPGEDRDENDVYIQDLKEIIQKGNPISFGFLFKDKVEKNFGHQVVITQIINWKDQYNDNYKLIIYNNDQSVWTNFLTDFQELWLKNIEGIIDFNNKTISSIELKDNHPTPKVVFNLKEGAFLSLDNDSQNIYVDPSTSESTQNLQLPNAVPKNSIRNFDKVSWTAHVENLNSTYESGYIEIVVIGAESFKVYDNSTSKEITLMRDGDLDGEQSVYIHEPNSILTKIYLPAKEVNIYRVEIIKDIQIPRLKVYTNVPKDNAYLEETGYNNVHSSLEDNTKVVFLVGEENTDHTLHRTSGSNEKDDVDPNFIEDIEVPVPAVRNFKGVISNNVLLTWENPSHSGFASVKILRKKDTKPSSDSDGTLIYQGNDISCSDTLPSAGVFYYTAFSYNSTPSITDSTYLMVDSTNYSISGSVTDQSTGAGIEEAVLTIESNDGLVYRNSTDSFGQYSFLNISNGNYTLKCEVSNYSISLDTRDIEINDNSVTEAFTATFTPETYTLDIQINPSGGGTVTRSPDKEVYSHGESVDISANVYQDFTFSGWKGDVLSGDNPLTIVMDSNKSITANLVLDNPPAISLSSNKLNFGATTDGIKTQDQQLRISNSGGGSLDWSVTDDKDWLSCAPAAGLNAGVITVSVNPLSLSEGLHNGTISVSDPNSSNLSLPVEVILIIKDLDDCTPPFGSFDTPIDGTTGVTGAIPVTGWVLDDIGLESVKIYRDKVDAEASIYVEDLVYIGDAGFVEGARPDVEQGNPNYPVNNKAGWGYMMLTNFLPGQGNGTYRIHAYATDLDGHAVSLGTKTIHCDNANAIKPFGAIDTPTQGGTVTGPFFNSGWALTPMPNNIPIDGSTINVWVDGVRLGNPAYNQYRNDIASLFPGYENTDGAVGAYYLDTTTYTNGVHTIAWSVKDNVGNSDGIGSRFFTIANTGGSAPAGIQSHNEELGSYISYESILNMPVNFDPVRFKRGYRRDIEPEFKKTNEYGLAVIEIREVERAEIALGNGVITGYMIVGEELRPLPIGSTLDTAEGIFYWQPGPGFIGSYDLVFIKTDEFGLQRRMNVKIKIRPKFGGNHIDLFKDVKAKGEAADIPC